MGRPSLIPPVLTGNVFAVTQEVVFLNQKCQFGFYYLQGGNGIVTDVSIGQNDIQLYWKTTIIPLLQPCLSVGTLIGDLTIWCMRWPDQATGRYPMGSLHGTQVGDPMPPQIAGVLSKITNLRGRSGRGRMYLCGHSEDTNTNGAPDPAKIAPYGTLCTTLKASWQAGGVNYTPVVVSLLNWSKDSMDPPVPPAAEGKPKKPPIDVRGGIIVEIVFDQYKWNTQRRRSIGRGQ